VILLGKNGLQNEEKFVTMKERQGGVSSISGLRTVYYMIKVLLAVFMAAFRGKMKERNAGRSDVDRHQQEFNISRSWEPAVHHPHIWVDKAKAPTRKICLALAAH
jgi:uncharacterized Zn-finger protein